MKTSTLSLLKSGARTLAVLGTVFFMGTTAFADGPGSVAFVQGKSNEMTAAIKAKEGDAATNALIDKFVDYDTFAQRSLGHPCPPAISSCIDRWAALTPPQQTEMTDLLRQVLQKSYRKTIAKTLDYNLSFKDQKTSPLGDFKVRSLAKSKLSPRDPEIQVDYLVRASGDPKVVDMIAEGASVTKNYYDALNKKIGNEGYPAAVKMLKDKIAKK